MSSFEVSTAHIDALVNAALAAGRDFYWYHDGPGNPYSERGEALPGFGSSAERHAAYLAYLGENKRTVTRANAGTWGALLVDANKRSVNYLYDEDEIEEPYTFTYHAGPFNPVAILRALSCYEYQCSDDPGWQDSEAREFCEALRSWTITQLPGWDQAAREVTDISQVLAVGARS